MDILHRCDRVLSAQAADTLKAFGSRGDPYGASRSPSTGTAAAAGGGNSASAQACQQAGWKQLATSSGSSFANAGDCASYAAQGGTFGATAPFLTLTSVSGKLVDFSGGGLEPSAPVYVCDSILDPTSCSDQISNVFSDGTFVGDTSCYVGEYLETSTATGAVIDSNAVTACF